MNSEQSLNLHVSNKSQFFFLLEAEANKALVLLEAKYGPLRNEWIFCSHFTGMLFFSPALTKKPREGAAALR